MPKLYTAAGHKMHHFFHENSDEYLNRFSNSFSFVFWNKFNKTLRGKTCIRINKSWRPRPCEI